MAVVKQNNSSVSDYIGIKGNEFFRSTSSTTELTKDFSGLKNDGLSLNQNGKSNTKDNLVKLPNLNTNDTKLSYSELTTILQRAMHGIEELERASLNYGIPDKTFLKDEQKLKEAEDKLIRTQKQFNLYKYYSFVWFFTMALLSFFLIMFFTGIFNSFVALVGVVSTVVGGIGAYIDWKDKEKEYDQ